ncbi:PAP2-domain-containing protein, partial [Meredithblackwellia eburnea MCA 4105]
MGSKQATKPPETIRIGSTRWSRWALATLQNTQVVVTLLTFVAILRIRTAHAVWFGAGSLVALISAKILKRFIRQPRPLGAKKYEKTYGMPSTHSSSIAFFGVYLSLSSLLLPLHPRVTSLLPFWDTLALRAIEQGPSLISNFGHWGTRTLLAVFWISAAASVCWSRVRLGHHTPPQVLAGAALGSVVAVIWLSMWLGLEETGLATLLNPGGKINASILPSWISTGVKQRGLVVERAVEDVGVVIWDAAKKGDWQVVKNSVWEVPPLVLKVFRDEL